MYLLKQRKNNKTGFHGYQTKPITANHIEQIISQYFTNIKKKNIKSTKKTNVSSDNKKDKKPKKITSSDKQIKVELPIIDMNQALELTGGNEDLVKEMQQMLLEELQSETEKLNSFYEEKNIEKVKFIAHKIQGGASYCGTARLKEQTKNVERLCYQVQDDTSNKKLQKDLRIAFDSLLDTIQQTSKALEKNT